MIAALIPAYNEATAIRQVLAVLRAVPLIDEILVVDDGSSDHTAGLVQAAARQDRRLRCIRHPFNRGKGQAVFTGLGRTQAEIIVLLDADLINLQPTQVEALIRPVLAGQFDMTIGLFRGGRFHTDLAHWATPWLSGQRCLRRGMFECIHRAAARGYGLETAITVAIVNNEWKVKKVWLDGVYHPASETHRGSFFYGLLHRLRMYLQIARAWRLAGGFQSYAHKISRRIPLASTHHTSSANRSIK